MVFKLQGPNKIRHKARKPKVCIYSSAFCFISDDYEIKL